MRASQITFGWLQTDELITQSLIDEVSHLFDRIIALEDLRPPSQRPAADAYFMGRLRSTLSSLAYQIMGFAANQRPLSQEILRYRHEPWQGAVLSPTPLAPRAMQQSLFLNRSIGLKKHEPRAWEMHPSLAHDK